MQVIYLFSQYQRRLILTRKNYVYQINHYVIIPPFLNSFWIEKYMKIQKLG